MQRCWPSTGGGVGSDGTTKRRQAGEGGISEYQTKAGPRFLIKYPVLQEDGTKRVVLKRGFTTRRQAAAALRAEIGKAEPGEWVQPSKQPPGGLPCRVARGSAAGARDVGQLPEERAPACRALPGGHADGPSDRPRGRRVDAHPGGVRSG